MTSKRAHWVEMGLDSNVRQTLSVLRSEVIVDVVPDARVIAKNSDAVIFCVRWNKTARDTVIEGLRSFAQINVKIVGIVLSQVNAKKMVRYGYSGYGYHKESKKYYRN
jgi:Mrp family chromosome partitioning ATPase